MGRNTIPHFSTYVPPHLSPGFPCEFKNMRSQVREVRDDFKSLGKFVFQK